MIDSSPSPNLPPSVHLTALLKNTPHHMKALMSLLTALTVPLVLMNMLGGVVSGIWLAFLGEWKAIGMGIFILFASIFVLGLALMPNLIFAAPAAKALESGKKSIGMILAGLTSLYTCAVMLGWGVLIFVYFYKQADSSSLIPMLLWSYGAVTAPWVNMAQKDDKASGGNSLAFIPVFFLSIGYLAIILTVLTVGASLQTCIVTLGVFLLLGAAAVFATAVVEDKARRSHTYH